MTGPMSPAFLNYATPAWVVAPAGSGWIGPDTCAPPLGTYSYTLRFDLTGFDPTTASISADVAFDNALASMLNGNQVAFNGGGFTALTPLTIESGFVAGVNLLEFDVTNTPGGGGGCNPSGLLVANVDAQATPAPATCAPTPATGCHLAAAARSSISIADNPDSTRQLFKWNWKAAPTDTTAVGDFRDPLSASPSLRACVYDGSGNLQPLTQAQILPGGTCAGKPCWKLLGSVASPTGYKYRNKAATPDGLTDARLKAGTNGGAQVSLTGKGSLLQNPTLGLTMPVTVELLIGDGTGTACWQTTYNAAKVNTAGKFSAKGP